MTNPLFLESKELIDVFYQAFLEEIYKEIPKEDYDVIMKYDSFVNKGRLKIVKHVDRESKKTTYTGSY